ncbi:MAG: SMP-30/gluconolactonase/LRE family protein [Anaerolineae bacterium]|nr:SMP-30/gluconolactonase/LRE family protein [Anaerolineae bacterium]
MVVNAKPELIVNYQCICGEGPIWHPDERRLYWLDIDTGRIFRYHPASEKHEQIYQGEKIGGLTIQADGSLALYGPRGAVYGWHDGEITNLVRGIPGEESRRFNDCIADPEGRVFAGTLGDTPGNLYRIDPDGTVTHIVGDVGCSNGMGFTPDLTGMYYVDSVAGVVYRFDYDRATGSLTNQRSWLEVDTSKGIPDGMTVDAEGYVWVAFWDGSRVARYDPTGRLVATVTIPARKTSCLIFGGTDMTDIYITTAIGDGDPTLEGQYAGGLFRVNLGIRGVPEFRSRIGQ